jgi:hypothetical protein
MFCTAGPSSWAKLKQRAYRDHREKGQAISSSSSGADRMVSFQNIAGRHHRRTLIHHRKNHCASQIHHTRGPYMASVKVRKVCDCRFHPRSTVAARVSDPVVKKRFWCRCGNLGGQLPDHRNREAAPQSCDQRASAMVDMCSLEQTPALRISHMIFIAVPADRKAHKSAINRPQAGAQGCTAPLNSPLFWHRAAQHCTS